MMREVTVRLSFLVFLPQWHCSFLDFQRKRRLIANWCFFQASPTLGYLDVSPMLSALNAPALFLDSISLEVILKWHLTT